MSAADNDRTIELTSEIVAAYVSNNSVGREDLGSLIAQVHTALRNAPSASSTPEPEPQEPAVQIRKSIRADRIICLEDGKTFKSLRRHLGTDHNMTADEYRAKWGLKPDYPMVAPDYAKARSELVKAMGLGQKRLQRQGENGSTATAAKGSRRTKANAS